jgi:hypothetical protein
MRTIEQIILCWAQKKIVDFKQQKEKTAKKIGCCGCELRLTTGSQRVNKQKSLEKEF